MLLSPGVFLRLANNSEVRMISTDLVDPRVEVVRGEAMVEVDQKVPNARVDILEHGADASIMKTGLYRFDGNTGSIAVYDGKLNVTVNDQSKELGKGKQIVLNGGPKLEAGELRSPWKKTIFTSGAAISASIHLAECHRLDSAVHLRRREPLLGRRLVLESVLHDVVVAAW